MNRLITLLFAMFLLGCGACCANDNPAHETATGSGDAVMTGKVDLWQKGNIPTVTQNVNNSDGPDFIPNLEVFTVPDNVEPKGAVMICPGGAFIFRSMQNEGYDIADMLTSMGYQRFVVNYRINPYTMRESATDLQRGIRYVRAHAADYRIKPENIALVGFSAGGILNGEVLLNWRGLINGTALDPTYVSDELDNVPVDACAVGMIYSFYGRLSVSMNDVATLRAAKLPRPSTAGALATALPASSRKMPTRWKRPVAEWYARFFRTIPTDMARAAATACGAPTSTLSSRASWPAAHPRRA